MGPHTTEPNTIDRQTQYPPKRDWITDRQAYTHVKAVQAMLMCARFQDHDPTHQIRDTETKNQRNLEQTPNQQQELGPETKSPDFHISVFILNVPVPQLQC